jgi:hypothetical protein
MDRDTDRGAELRAEADLTVPDAAAGLVKRLPRERFPDVYDVYGVRFWPATAATFRYIWRQEFRRRKSVARGADVTVEDRFKRMHCKH